MGHSFGRIVVTALMVGWVGLPVAGQSQPPVGARQPQQVRPEVGMMDSPTVTVLKGLTVPQFEDEMRHIVQALGVTCGHCHAARNFASDENPKKVAARRMLEMTRAVNQQFFADYRPAPGESTLGKVTCFTCHQGNELPTRAPGADLR